MNDLFLTLFFISLLGLVVGLVRPPLVLHFLKGDKTRKKVALVFGGGAFLFLILVGVTAPPTEQPEETTPVPQEEITQPLQKEVEKQEPEKEIIEKPAVSDQKATAVIKTTLGAFGISDITTMIADGREKGGVKVLILTYRSNALTETELAEEMGRIVGAYMGVVKGGWDIDELSVVVGNVHGIAVGMWYCSKEWTDSFIKGEITEKELMLKVMGSMTSF